MTGWARLRGKEPLYTTESLEALQSNRDMRSTKASADLGFAARPFEQSVYDLYAWHRSVGNIPADAELRVPSGVVADAT